MALIAKERIWPTLIIAALGGNLILGAVMIRVAAGDTHFAVEPDYYRKAVGWDSTMAQADRNNVLGWHAVPSLGAIRAGANDTLAITLRTDAGVAVTGAKVTIEAMPVAYANEVVRAALAADHEPGRYVAAVPMSRAGLWEVRLRAVRGAERFTTNLRLEASSTAAAVVITERPGDRPR